ncbi:hypothetical protein MiTa_04709 [Microcystis aeruginosa NIES-4264]|nr:hypothetical protein MiHa_04641 [Microcystis aeruginosa NIES-2522]GCA91341.1 hypothetical protein MiTa_04709 [Microcystis aeruginosa NIES-4264]
MGVWQGSKAEFTTNWLRWWDKSGNLLLWGSELVEQERQRAEQERQRAEQERQRAEQERQRTEQERQRAEQAELELEQEQIARQRLVQKLKELGVNPENL